MMFLRVCLHVGAFFATCFRISDDGFMSDRNHVINTYETTNRHLQIRQINYKPGCTGTRFQFS